MPRRIDIELTSSTEGAWTWRAAGARQPKGSVPDDLVPGGAKVGDVLRAEVESGMEGLEILSLAAKEGKAEASSANRIEVLGAPKREPGVSVAYAPGARRRREDGDRPGRREGGPRAGRREGPGGPGGPQEGGRRPAGGRSRPGAGADRGPGRGAAERERRPAVSTVHRNALLATLGPEQLPVAEQLLRGGIPAVRKAIAEQPGGPRGGTVNADQLLAIAEQLLPAVNLASWKDRAAAAQAEGAELRLRDLRAVVAASRAVTLDEEGRAMARALREAQDKRVAAVRDAWLGRITGALEEGRILDALSTAQRAPEPGTRLPAELAVRLADATGTAMVPTLEGREWLALLDAVLESPVRRTVKPAGIPATPVAQESARHAAGLVPELAKLLGLRIPPPPPRRTVVRRGPLTRSGGGGAAAAP